MKQKFQTFKEQAYLDYFRTFSTGAKTTIQKLQKQFQEEINQNYFIDPTTMLKRTKTLLSSYQILVIQINDTFQFAQIPQFGQCILKIFLQMMSIIKWLLKIFLNKSLKKQVQNKKQQRNTFSLSTATINNQDKQNFRLRQNAKYIISNLQTDLLKIQQQTKQISTTSQIKNFYINRQKFLKVQSSESKNMVEEAINCLVKDSEYLQQFIDIRQKLIIENHKNDRIDLYESIKQQIDLEFDQKLKKVYKKFQILITKSNAIQQKKRKQSMIHQYSQTNIQIDTKSITTQKIYKRINQDYHNLQNQFKKQRQELNMVKNMLIQKNKQLDAYHYQKNIQKINKVNQKQSKVTNLKEIHNQDSQNSSDSSQSAQIQKIEKTQIASKQKRFGKFIKSTQNMKKKILPIQLKHLGAQYQIVSKTVQFSLIPSLHWQIDKKNDSLSKLQKSKPVQLKCLFVQTQHTQENTKIKTQRKLTLCRQSIQYKISKDNSNIYNNNIDHRSSLISTKNQALLRFLVMKNSNKKISTEHTEIQTLTNLSFQKNKSKFLIDQSIDTKNINSRQKFTNNKSINQQLQQISKLKINLQKHYQFLKQIPNIDFNQIDINKLFFNIDCAKNYQLLNIKNQQFVKRQTYCHRKLKNKQNSQRYHIFTANHEITIKKDSFHQEYIAIFTKQIKRLKKTRIFLDIPILQFGIKKIRNGSNQKNNNLNYQSNRLISNLEEFQIFIEIVKNRCKKIIIYASIQNNFTKKQEQYSFDYGYSNNFRNYKYSSIKYNL